MRAYILCDGFILNLTKEVFWPYFGGIVGLGFGLFAVWKAIVKTRGWDTLIALGPAFFGAPLTAFAAEHFVLTRNMMPLVPAWIPAHFFWILLVGVALLAAVLSIYVNRKVWLSGTLLGVMFILFVLLMDVPAIIANPRNRFFWALAARELVFACAALILAATHTEQWRVNGKHWVTKLSALVIAMALIFYGVEHFLHPQFVPGVPLNKLMPAWIPWRSMWGYLTGTGLALAGLSIMIKQKSRIAVTALGLGLLLLVIFIYLPMMLATWSGSGSPIEGLNFFADTLMFGGAVLILAGALPKGLPESSRAATRTTVTANI
jgi:uncharacterized membrane protein